MNSTTESSRPPVLRGCLKGRQAERDQEHVQYIKTDIRYLTVLKRSRKVAEYCRRNGYEQYIDQIVPVIPELIGDHIRQEIQEYASRFLRILT